MVARRGFGLAAVFAALMMALALVPLCTGTAYADTVRCEEGWDCQLNDNGTAAITGKGTHDEAVLTIPASVTSGSQTYAVTEIGDRAFMNNTTIKEVTVSEGITRIGEDAFRKCSDMEQIDLPRTLTSFGGYAFQQSGLKSVELPEGLTETSCGLFLYCGSLSSVDLPSSLQKIEMLSFFSCGSLVSIDIPASVQEIGGRAFENSGLTSVVLPEGLTTIQGYQFTGCSNLAEITIPSTVTIIDWGSIDETSLTTIHFGGSPEQWNAISQEGDKLDIEPVDYWLAYRAVAFDPNTGTGEMDAIHVMPGETCTLPDCAFTAPSGKVFQGWNTVAVGTAGNYGTWYDPGDIIEPAGDMTLYARWNEPALSLCSYDITNSESGRGGTFKDNYWGEFGEPSYGCNNYTVHVGDQYTVTAYPDNGYRFVGWYAGEYLNTDAAGNPTQDARPYMDQDHLLTTDPTYTFTITDNTVLCPVFEESAIIYHIVGFDANGGSGVMGAVQLAEGEAYTLPTICTFTAPAGYKFAGWTLDGNAVTQVTVNSNMTVKAKWTQATTRSVTWKRLAGATAPDTMKLIAGQFGKAKVAVVTTDANYKDALAASALAGKNGAIVLMTKKGSLTAQTKQALKAAGVKTVYLVGSTKDVTTKVEKALKSGPGVTKVTRVSGGSASAKAIAAAKVGGKRSDTVIIATQNGFQDALAIAPYSYVSKSPILYAETNKKLSTATTKFIKSAKYKKAIIVGGPIALPASIETQLKKAGVTSVTRLAGTNAYRTSAIIANWTTGQLKNGSSEPYKGKNITVVRFQPAAANRLQANKLAISTGQNWLDALAGAALCGKNKSVLLLADAKTTKSNYTLASSWCKTAFAKNTAFRQGYIFGGVKAVQPKVETALKTATKVTTTKVYTL